MPIDFQSLPLRELRKGRTLLWDPHAIDLSQDREDWGGLNDDEKNVVLSQVFGFLVGERAVAHDLAPLQQALRHERGHMEEEMYLTQQQFEESTHVEFFQRWLYEVLPGTLGVEVPYPPGKPSYLLRTLLPETMQAVARDPSPRAQLRAVVVYHQIVEGVMAEIGYQIFYDCLDERGILPGLRNGVRNIQVDESRHIAFGTYLAQRLIRDDESLRNYFVESMDEILPLCIEGAEGLFNEYDEPVPFGLERERTVNFARELHRRRMEAVLSGGLVGA